MNRRIEQMRDYFYSRKVPILNTDTVRANWPTDVPFDEAICSKIQREWVQLKMNEAECIAPFIRKRVPTQHKGEVAIAPECSCYAEYEIAYYSVGPFSHGTGGGVRNIRKGHEMS